MVQINYQTYGNGFNLRLRLYKDGETKFINVNKKLQGNLQKRHWNLKMKCFYNSAPYAQANNDFLMRFAQPYRDKAESWNGSLSGFLASFEEVEPVKEDRGFVKAIDRLIEEMKSENVHKDGTLRGGFEDYEKLQKRIKEFCSEKKISPESLVIDDMTTGMINSILTWAKNRKTGHYLSATLRAALNRLAKKGEYDFSQAENCQWWKKNRCSNQTYYTLSDDV